MKQMLQNLKNGKVSVQDVPQPVLRDEGLLVRSRTSLVSAGTERMMTALARKSLLGKARQRPDLVRKVLEKLHRDGFWATLRAVRDRLEREVPLGYSVAGEVIDVGARATQFQLGQQVACAGAGYANHAEINYVPRLLAVPVPSAVSSEAAAYATVGAIALQGIRNADPRVGETVVVLGLGLIGQLALQVLKASGCRVVGLDTNNDRLKLAASNGADLTLAAQEPGAEKAVLEFTRGRGADAIIISAATTSNAPVELAARLARDRARVVMVGVTGMQIPRKPYYEKELTFIVSRSYGPGRYDRQYEQYGHDYPAGYVRWTENRNIEAFLDLAAAGSVRPEVCTTHRFPIHQATAAFELILTNREPHLGVILTYPDGSNGNATNQATRISLPHCTGRKRLEVVGVSLIGAGSFARSVHLPNLARFPEVQLRGIADTSGISARSAGNKFGFDFCTSTETEIYSDPETDVVFIATPHSQHAGGVCRALAAGKSVFVEKPLAITLDQLRQVCQTYESHPHGLMVGFNRRFSPLAAELKQFIGGRGPLSIQYRCNAGPLPEDHWIADPAEGGRIIGEACHFFDFFAYLTDARPLTVYAAAPSAGSTNEAAITVTYADGSVCQLTYTSSGPSSFSKEKVEVFAGGAVGVLEDFRRLQLCTRSQRPKRRRLLRPDKGHRHELGALLAAIRSGQRVPIDPESLVATTLVALAALESIQRGKPVTLAELQNQAFSNSGAS